MRILCDHHVATKYVEAFRDADDLEVAMVRDVLSADASDDAIARYATRHGWVVFTNDTDFREGERDHGVVAYDQIDDPRPGEVVAALRKIATVYEAHDAIDEFVPGGWV